MSLKAEAAALLHSNFISSFCVLCLTFHSINIRMVLRFQTANKIRMVHTTNIFGAEEEQL